MSQSPWQELEELVESQSPKVVKKNKKTRSEANHDLWVAIMNLDERKVREALEDGASPDARFPSSKNFPLEHVLSKGEVGMADLLVEFGTTRLGNKGLCVYAFDEDKPATLEWVLHKKGDREFKEYPLNSDYPLLEYAKKGRIQCFQWLIKNFDRMQKAQNKNQNILDWITPYFTIMPDEALMSNKGLASLLKAHNQPSMKKISEAWYEGVNRDAVEFLRILTRNQWFPDYGICWPWEATLKGSGKTVKWLIQAPAFEKQFEEAIRADYASSRPRLLNSPWVNPEIISVLADKELLPTKEELSSTKYTEFYLYHDHYHKMTKSYVETLARKWPDALRATNQDGQTMFDLLLNKSFEKDKVLEWKAFAEKMMMKKSIIKPLTQKARKEMGLEAKPQKARRL